MFQFFRDGVENFDVENSDVFSLICARWCHSTRACGCYNFAPTNHPVITGDAG